MYLIDRLQVLLLIGLLGIACQKTTPNDPSSELAQLRQEKAAIERRMRELEKQVQASQVSPAVHVTVLPVTPVPFINYLEVHGTIDADEHVTLTPQMPVQITGVYVRVGQKVQKGQLLAEVENSALQKNLEALQTQLEFARNLYGKQKSLWQQQIGSEVQYLTAKNNVETLEKQVAAAEEQLRQTKLIAPFAGTIDAVDIKVGQLAVPGLKGIRLINLNSLKVTASVSETYAGKIRIGNPVTVWLPDINDSVQTSLRYVSAVINSQARSFDVEAPLPARPAYKPNMLAKVKIQEYVNPQAIVVDLNLLQKANNQSFIMVAEQKEGQLIASRRIVQQGRTYAGKVEILSGLAPNDLLITTNYQDLAPGQLITVSSMDKR